MFDTRMIRILALIAAIVAVVIVGLLISSRSKGQEPQCYPDMKTIQNVIEDIQRIRVNGESADTSLRAIRDSLKKR